MPISVDSMIRLVMGVDVSRVTAPLEAGSAWEVEAFLLKIFEYGDYRFRSALRGDYSDTLDCTFALAQRTGRLIGAAGCLCSRQSPTAAIVGPVGVHPEYRRRGIGTELLGSLVEHLKRQGCTAAYLGVSPKNPAVRLYRKIGFGTHHGIVMELPLDAQGGLNERRLQNNSVSIRRVCWGDFPPVSALLSHPCSMHTYHLQRGLFSSKYVPPSRFLSVFPDMMKAFARHGGFANVLVAGEKQHVVGIAQVNRFASAPQEHIAELEFYVRDDFVERAIPLVEQTLRESSALSARHIHGRCLSCDHTKRRILEHLGGNRIAVLPDNVLIDENPTNVLIYELGYAL